MKAVINKASDWSFKEVIDISSLEELIDFYKKGGDGLVIRVDTDADESEYLHITIYDDYLE